MPLLLIYNVGPTVLIKSNYTSFFVSFFISYIARFISACQKKHSFNVKTLKFFTTVMLLGLLSPAQVLWVSTKIQVTYILSLTLLITKAPVREHVVIFTMNTYLFDSSSDL